MVVDKLDLGFSEVYVTVNGNRVAFQVDKNPNNSMWLDDGTVLHPKGCLALMINVLPYQVGDVIRVEFHQGSLVYDGGGERKDNIVGEIAEFTVGMGVPATDEYEAGFKWSSENWPDDMHRTKRVLPYENWGATSCGFEFHMVDTPAAYQDRTYRTNILVEIAWEPSSSDYAWDIVSFLTSF